MTRLLAVGDLAPFAHRPQRQDRDDRHSTGAQYGADQQADGPALGDEGDGLRDVRLRAGLGEEPAVGDEIGASAQETVLAWLLATTPVMIPIPGATRPATIDSIVRSLSIVLSDDQRARLDATQAEMESMYPDDLPRSPLG